MQTTNNSKKGFTIIELVIALAIVALLASIALPSFIGWLQERRLSGATVNLLSDLEQAKMRAIRENVFVAVLFSGSGYLIFVDNGAGSGEAGDWIRNGDEPLVLSRALPSGVTIQLHDMSLLNSRIRFNGRGFPVDVTATEIIPIVNSVSQKNVTITRLGNVRIQ